MGTGVAGTTSVVANTAPRGSLSCMFSNNTADYLEQASSGNHKLHLQGELQNKQGMSR